MIRNVGFEKKTAFIRTTLHEQLRIHCKACVVPESSEWERKTIDTTNSFLLENWKSDKFH